MWGIWVTLCFNTSPPGGGDAVAFLTVTKLSGSRDFTELSSADAPWSLRNRSHSVSKNNFSWTKITLLMASWRISVLEPGGLSTVIILSGEFRYLLGRLGFALALITSGRLGAPVSIFSWLPLGCSCFFPIYLKFILGFRFECVRRPWRAYTVFWCNTENSFSRVGLLHPKIFTLLI